MTWRQTVSADFSALDGKYHANDKPRTTYSSEENAGSAGAFIKF